MNKNLGGLDRVIRILLGLLVLAAGYYFQSIFGLIGIVLIFTAAMGWCPAYALLGLSTCSVKNNEKPT